MDAQNLLTQLRDIHYPPAISIWPLAMGWYALIALILLVAGTITYVLIKRWQKQHLKRLVLSRIEELQAQQKQHHMAIAEELSALLKRAALASFPRSQVAGLYADNWLAFLDKTGATNDFSQGPGKLLVVCPYQGKQQDLPEQLFHLIKDWVKKNL